MMMLTMLHKTIKFIAIVVVATAATMPFVLCCIVSVEIGQRIAFVIFDHVRMEFYCCDTTQKDVHIDSIRLVATYHTIQSNEYFSIVLRTESKIFQ